MKKRRIVVTLVSLLIAGAVFSFGFFGGRMTGSAPVPGALLTRLDSLGLEPHPSITRFVEPGAVYLPTDLKSPYKVSDAFKDHAALMSEPATPFGKSSYLDRFESETKSSVLLSYLGLSVDENTKRIRTVESEIDGFTVADIRMDVFPRAEFTETMAGRLDSTRSIIAAQSVGTAKACRLRLRDESNADLKLKDAGFLDVFSRRSSTVTAEESFVGFNFASKPVLRAGGAGSNLTPETAKSLAQKLSQAGIDAHVDGTTVWAPLSWNQAPVAFQLTMAVHEAEETATALVRSDAALRDVRNELTTVRQDAAQTSEQLQAIRQASSDLGRRNQELEQLHKQLTAETLKTKRQADELRRQLANLSTPPIDPETRSALASIAGRYPKHVQFDAARGTIRFTDDQEGPFRLSGEAAAAFTSVGKVFSEKTRKFDVVISPAEPR
jgi:hypothetical protein